MKSTSLLIYTTHGTYGRDDDGYGALMAGNAALAMGLDATLLLVDDGVVMAKSGQNTTKIGLPNNLEDLQDFIDLGGKLFVVRECLEERGISDVELIGEAKVIGFTELPGIIQEHSTSITL